MKFFSLFALLAFSGLASAKVDPKKQTISELYSQVTSLRHKADHAVSDYKEHKYNAFAKQLANYEFSSSIAEWVAKLPANSTYETNMEAEMAMSELTVLSFAYPIIADPTKLSDALKVKALIYGVDKESRNDTTTPTLMELRKSVLQIIDEENKIGRNWTKTNLVLDNLYEKIDVNLDCKFKLSETEAFLDTSGYPTYVLEHVKDFCDSVPSSGLKCHHNLLEAVLTYQGFISSFQKLLPVQNAEILENVIETLKKCSKQKDIVDDLIEKMHVECDAIRCRRYKAT